MHTERMPCEHEGRNWDDGSTNQEMPEIAATPHPHPHKPGESHETNSPSGSSEGTSHSDTLILDL